MLSADNLLRLHHQILGRQRLVIARCSGIRKIISENTRLVEQSIELLLSSKETLRQVDETMSKASSPERTANE